jgi:signal recognition particle subunit SRP54
MRKNRFTLADFLDQMEQIKGMGDISSLAAMMPGVNASALEGADPDGKGLAHIEAIIRSMTPAEREDPAILNASRKRRIAQGCGLQVADVNRLLKQFEQMRELMKMVSGGRMPAGLMGGKMPKGMLGGMGRMAKRAQKQKKKKKK